MLSGQYGGGKAIPVVIPAGGNVITNESETFSDTNLTVYSSYKFNPKFVVQYSK